MVVEYSNAFDLINGKHCGSLTFHITFPCDQCSAESAHDTGDIRTDGFTPCDLFKASQYGVIVESTALYDDMISEFGGVGNFDHLKQRILITEYASPAEMSATAAPSFCACLTLEFINTVQRVPRSIGFCA